MITIIPHNIPTLDELVQQILRFDPRQSARNNDGSLCVTDVIECIEIDGQSVQLQRLLGRYGGGYARVSSAKQRTQTDVARASGKRKRQHYKTEGQSEAEQIERLLRYFASKGQAFRIYSDAALSGEYPHNRPAHIAKMLRRKAQRYRTNFERVLLDGVSLQEWTPAQEQALRKYLSGRVQAIEHGYVSDDAREEVFADAAPAPSQVGGEVARQGRRGSAQAYHRQGYSTLLDDIEANRLHTLVTIEGSRICRDADLHVEFMQACSDHSVQAVGLMRDFFNADMNEPMEKAMSYMMASMDAQRLSEISRHCFRGLVHSLKSGIANGKLPFWLTRDHDSGQVITVAAYVAIVERIVEKSLCGQGISSIHADLKRDGVLIEGKPVSHSQINTVLSTPAAIGKQSFFGLDWPTLPRVIDDATYGEVQHARTQRREMMDAKGGIHDPRRWAVHELTHVMRCWCGRLLRRRYQAEAASGKRHYYWDCAAKQQGRPHARLQAEHLEAFVFDLCRYNPQILAGAFAAADGDSGALQQAQYRLLQARLRDAEQAYEERQASARQEAERQAAGLHIQPASPHYATIVAGLVGDALQTEVAALQMLREQVNCQTRDVAQARQSEALQHSLGRIREWDDLDVITRNRLIGSVFDKIVLHMPNEEGNATEAGRLDLYLTGLDMPLPPVPLWRGSHRTLLLPTVEEWIASIFAS